jgi:hypothetical protein
MRDMLEDYSVPADEQMSPNGTATKFKLQRLRVNDDSYFQVVANNSVVPLVSSLSALVASGPLSCFVDFNTGMITFSAAPPIGVNTVVCYHNQVRWLDRTILGALYEGLQDLYPTLWRNAQTSAITLQTLKWDYPLPNDFLDPRMRIKGMSVQEIPSSLNPFLQVNWPFTVYGNPPMVRLLRSQKFSPGSHLQIEYAAPYRNLADLEPQAASLPIYYAMSVLMAAKESQRTRADGQTVAADTNAQPPQYLMQTAGYWKSMYTQKKAAMARPMGGQHPVISTYGAA